MKIKSTEIPHTIDKQDMIFEHIKSSNPSYILHYSDESCDLLWEPIVIDGEETGYQISTYGDVIGHNGNPISQSKDSCGYPHVNLCYNGKTVCRKTHRLVAQAFIPNDDPEHKTQIDHLNGKKYDNWYGNLEWVTQKENIIRAWRNGLCEEGRIARSGENHWNNKYAESVIRNICDRLEKGHNPTDIARDLEVPVHVVYGIRNGGWDTISKEYNITDEDGKSLYTTRTLTKDQATKACELLEKGIPPTRVAEMIGTTPYTIYGLKYRTTYKDITDGYSFNTKYRRVSDEDAHKVCQLYASGKFPVAIHREMPHIPIKDITKITSSSSDSYKDIRSQYDFTKFTRTRDRGVPNEMVHKICKMLVDGMSPAEISNITEVPITTVRNIRFKTAYKDIASQYTFPDNIKKNNRKLDPDTVHKICRMIQDRMQLTTISRELGVSIDDVSNIRVGSAYKDISSQYTFPKSMIQRIDDSIIHKACQMMQDGIPTADVAKQLEISPNILYAIRSKCAYRDIASQYTFNVRKGNYGRRRMA